MDSQSNDWWTISVFNKLHTTTTTKSLQSCPTLCNPIDGSPPGSPVPGILQARILEWVAMPSSRGSSQPRDEPCITGGFFTIWATREVNRKFKSKFILCFNYFQNNNQQFLYRKEICHRGLKTLLWCQTAQFKSWIYIYSLWFNFLTRKNVNNNNSHLMRLLQGLRESVYRKSVEAPGIA